MPEFDYEKLDVYQASISFITTTKKIIRNFPEGKSNIADQLSRAASSITLNIAEGAGEFSRNEKARFYRFARRSTTECAANLDICRNLEIIDNSLYEEGRLLLKRIIEMLIKLVNRMS